MYTQVNVKGMSETQRRLSLIVPFLLKGKEISVNELMKYCNMLLKGNAVIVSNHDIDKQLSREEWNLFSVRYENGFVRSIKLKNTTSSDQEVSIELLVDAVLNACLPFKRVMNQLIDWMESCTNDTREELITFLVYILSRSPGENIAFGYLRSREFVRDNLESLFGIVTGLYHNEEYQFSLQVGEVFKTFEVVKRNPQLFKDVITEAVKNRPEPKPDADISAEFNVVSAEFPRLEWIRKPPASVEVAKLTREDRLSKLEMLLKCNLPPGLKVEVMQMFSPDPVKVAKPTRDDRLGKIQELLESNLPPELKVEVMQMFSSI